MDIIVHIATRRSPLALWQANFVKEFLTSHHTNVKVKLLRILTVADKMRTIPLNKIGGKGLFVKELEKAILDHQADLAVHSVKDIPTEFPDGLDLAVIVKRGDPRDAFVSNRYANLSELPQKAIVGTSSLRRKAQILMLRPDLQVVPLRGNIGTRLQKLDEQHYDAIILAAVGLVRLGMSDRIGSYLDTDQMLPAAGQGAIGIECRCQDEKILSLVAPLDDLHSRYEIMAERVLTQQLGGSCQFPIAALARCNQDSLVLKGLVSNEQGTEVLRVEQSGPKEMAVEIGLKASEGLIKQGALQLLAKMRSIC